MDGRLTFADEHMVSATLRNLLASLMRSRSHAGRPVVLLATPSGERHEFGLLLAALHVLESGLGVCYLGPDLPADQIVAAAGRARVAVVGVGVVDGSNRTRAAAEVRRIERTLPRGVEIWIGGRDARHLRARVAPTRALVLGELTELEAETRRLRALGAAATDRREH